MARRLLRTAATRHSKHFLHSRLVCCPGGLPPAQGGSEGSVSGCHQHRWHNRSAHSTPLQSPLFLLGNVGAAIPAQSTAEAAGVLLGVSPSSLPGLWWTWRVSPDVPWQPPALPGAVPRQSLPPAARGPSLGQALPSTARSDREPAPAVTPALLLPDCDPACLCRSSQSLLSQSFELI